MQSYPVFALPFTAFVQYIGQKKWRWVFYILCSFLLVVNIFQSDQYHKTILHYYDMNRQYYGRIYLNPHPGPLDMSLLDNKEVLNDTKRYTVHELMNTDVPKSIKFKENAEGILFEAPINTKAGDAWILVDCSIKVNNGYWDAYLNTILTSGDTLKHNHIRLFNPISQGGQTNHYQFYTYVPQQFKNSHLKVYISANGDFDGIAEKIKVTELVK
jgi:hypothetical protein